MGLIAVVRGGTNPIEHARALIGVWALVMFASALLLTPLEWQRHITRNPGGDCAGECGDQRDGGRGSQSFACTPSFSAGGKDGAVKRL
ncbi:MAG: hypothetical protein U0670_10340 [Anaerolineae bacterium]